MSLASIACLVILLLVFINLPFSRNLVTGRVNALFQNLELPLHIQTIQSVRLKKVKLEGFSILDTGGDTIIYAGNVEARVKLMALMKSKVIVDEAELNGIVVNLVMDYQTQSLKIAEAFKKNKEKKSVDPKKKGSKWEIRVQKGDINSAQFFMEDTLSGIHILNEVQNLKVKRFRLSLLEREIKANSIELKKSKGSVKVSPGGMVKKKAKNKAATPWNYGIKDLLLEEIDFTYEHISDSLLLKLDMDKGILQARQMDIPGKILDLDNISFEGTRGNIYTSQKSGSANDAPKNKIRNFPWNIKTKQANLGEVDLITGVYADQRGESGTEGLGIEGLEMKLRDFQISQNQVGMKLKSLGFNLSNGFVLEQMKADLKSDSESTSLSLEVETGRSQFTLEGESNMGFFDLLKDPAASSDANLQIKDALIHLADISTFVPFLEEMSLYPSLADTPTELDVLMKLEENKLSLSKLSLAQTRKFNLSFHGFAEDAFKPIIASGQMELALSDINTPWLKGLLPETGIDSLLSDSTEISLFASLSDTFSAPEIVVKLASNLGLIDLSGHLNFNNRAYSMETQFEGIHLGSILGNPDMGSLSGSAEIEGTGLSSKTINSNIKLYIDSMSYRGYTYTQAVAEGSMKAGEYDFILHTDDPAMSSSLSVHIQQTDSMFIAQAKGALDAQLDQLRFLTDTLAVKTQIEARLVKETNAFETGISLSEIRLKSPSDSAELLNMEALYRSDTSHTTLRGHGDFFNLDIQVEKSIHELDGFAVSYGNYLRTFVDSSLNTAEHREEELPGIYATSNISNHKVLDILLQDTSLNVSNLSFSILNEPVNRKIKYEIDGSNIKYKRARLGELNLIMTDSAGVLNLDAIADSSSIYSSPPSSFLISAQHADWSSLVNLIIQTSRKDTIYDIEIKSVVDNNQMLLSVPSQHLILNHESWHLDSAHILSLELDSFKLIPRLKMRTDSSLIELYAGLEEGLPNYHLNMDQVKFASLIWDDLISGWPKGYISGNIDLTSNPLEGKRIETDLSIRDVSYSDLEFNQVKIGGFLAIKDSGYYSTQFSAELDTSLIEVEGDNILGENRSLKAEYSHVPLSIIQPFTRTYLSEMTGYVSGNFEEAGPSDSKKFTGSLSFRETKLKVVPLNTVYSIPDQSIQFEQDKIILSNFRVQDTLNQALLVDGFIDFKEKPVYSDLNISTSKLQLMNTTEADNENFYGQLFVDSKISFKGPVTKPDILAKILLSKGTKLNFNSRDDVDLSESSSVVNFISYSEIGEPAQITPIVSQPRFRMSTVETTIEIAPSTEINFGLSKRIFNINLAIQGGGLLNYSMLNNNQISLAGRYEIHDGSAELNITGWPNKYFVISKGGYVNWDGNVENPELKFEAISKVSSSYSNPVDGRIRNVDFNVILMLSQDLSDLNILFTIDTEDQYLMSIINTLSPEEKMRQAITILLFEIVDLPGISTSSDYMSQQVSQILASQLNQLTKSAIKGVDISFGIDTYTQSVQGGGENTSTSLSYEVKKSLLNDRAKIELSGRLQNPNDVPGAPDQSLNNVSFEYQLDSSQTKYLKVYNEQTYEDVFEGQVTKTGVGFTYRKPYKSFGDIWKRKKKRNEK